MKTAVFNPPVVPLGGGANPIGQHQNITLFISDE